MESFFNRVVSYVIYRWNQRVMISPRDHEALVELLALLRPQRAQGQRKVRVGSNRDGGYVMLDDFRSVDAALSLGVGPEVSWDYAIAERGIPVWQFDHTVKALPREHPLFHFEPKRIVTQASSACEVTLKSLLEQLGEKQLIVKMDIEGNEWDVLAPLDRSLLTGCRQLVVEFHNFMSVSDEDWCNRAQRTLDSLTQDFGVVHVHANNLSKHIVSKRLTLPDSLEVTFANRRHYRLEETNETFPGPNDRKNNPYFPDLRLGRFQFGPEV